MSLAMMIVQQDAAYLITDGGLWDDDGICTAIGSKVATLPHLNAAIALVGFNPNPHRIWDTLCDIGMRDARNVRDLLHLLPEIVRDLVRENVGRCSNPALTAHMITFVPDVGPAAWFVSSGGPNMPPSYKPFTLARAHAMIDVADRSVALGRPVNVMDPDSFDIENDGRQLAEIARHTPWTFDDGRTRYHVAGFAELTSVSAEGLQRRTICEWPDDRVGVPTLPRTTSSKRLLPWLN